MGKGQELLDAAREGDRRTVEKILGQITKRSGPFTSLRRGAGVNVQDINGYTPLHHACLNGHKDIVRLLLSVDASPCMLDAKGATPLHLAAFKGDSDIVRMLLAHKNPPVNIDQQTVNQETALLVAAQFGYVDIVAQLMAMEADVKLKNNKNESALDLAAQYGRVETVKHLLRYCPELIDHYRASETRGKIFTMTPLHLASRNKHTKVVELLIDAGMDPNIRTRDGTPLHEAARFGRDTVARVLLQRGADPNIRNTMNESVYDLLGNYSKATVRVSCVIQEYENQTHRTGYESDGYLPPFPVTDSSPTALPKRELPNRRNTLLHNANNCASTNNSATPETFSKFLNKHLDKSPLHKEDVFENSLENRSNSISIKVKFPRSVNVSKTEENNIFKNHNNVISEIKCLTTLNKSTPEQSPSFQHKSLKKNLKTSPKFTNRLNDSEKLSPNEIESNDLPDYVNISSLKKQKSTFIATDFNEIDDQPIYINAHDYDNLPDDAKVTLKKESIGSSDAEIQNMSTYVQMGSDIKNRDVLHNEDNICNSNKKNIYDSGVEAISEYVYDCGISKKNINNDLISDLLFLKSTPNDDVQIKENNSLEYSGDEEYVDMLRNKELQPIFENVSTCDEADTSFHLKGDPGCLFGKYDYIYVLNPQTVLSNVQPFDRKKIQANDMPCFCHKNQKINENMTSTLSDHHEEDGQDLYSSCSKLDQNEKVYQNLCSNTSTNIYSTLEETNSEQNGSTQNESIAAIYDDDDGLEFLPFKNTDDITNEKNTLTENNLSSTEGNVLNIIQKKFNHIKQLLLDW